MRLTAEKRRSRCPASCALDVLGDKWSLLVVRDMVWGRSRYFKEFLASPEGIATNILADRLTRLECSGIIAKQPDPENRSRRIYTLTEKGAALIPVLVELLCWGMRYDSVATDVPDEIRQIQQGKQDKQRVIRKLTKACLSPS